MKVTVKTILSVIILTFALVSCTKTPDFDVPNQPTPTEQTITQSFGLYTSTQVSPMKTKSWDKNTWTYNFSPLPYELRLTGVGNTNVYTQQITVAQLKAGTVSLTMLPGTYDVTFETIHTQAGDDWSINGTNQLDNQIGNVLDIKIQNTITVTGTPILLTATLEDALIVVDIPNTTKVMRFITSETSGIAPLLLNTVPTIHYGYLNKPTYLKIYNDASSPRVIDMTMIQKAQAYHVLTPFGATVNLIVPDMVVNTVVI